MATGIADRPISNTPIAIFDFETTGLTAGIDRVVEVSVLRMEPGRAPRLVLDTLVNPHRPMAATEIHGISDADVADAPAFSDIAADLVEAMSGCALAAYNIYFDVRFLEYELERCGICQLPPHFCLMYMRPLLNLGNRCNLEDACLAHGIGYQVKHVAAQDVLACAKLMEFYSGVLTDRGIRTFRELAALRSYKYLRSFSQDPLTASVAAQCPRCRRFKPRVSRLTPGQVAARTPQQPQPTKNSRAGMRSYWEALKAVISDLEITPDEMRYLKEKERKLGLQPEQIRVLHARAFVSAITQFVDDEWLDDRECRILRRLHRCLSQLGWAPGE